jgi:hypothetical protein
MTSSLFTIDQDFIHFRIGGGSHKGKTCINLVVNNKIVRTETGSESEDLEYKSWDVKDLKYYNMNINKLTV